MYQTYTKIYAQIHNHMDNRKRTQMHARTHIPHPDTYPDTWPDTYWDAYADIYGDTSQTILRPTARHILRCIVGQVVRYTADIQTPYLFHKKIVCSPKRNNIWLNKTAVMRDSVRLNWTRNHASWSGKRKGLDNLKRHDLKLIIISETFITLLCKTRGRKVLHWQAWTILKPWSPFRKRVLGRADGKRDWRGKLKILPIFCCKFLNFFSKEFKLHS